MTVLINKVELSMKRFKNTGYDVNSNNMIIKVKKKQLK